METVTPQQILDTPDLIAVGIAGDDVRRAMHGAQTTFVRVLEIHVDAPLQALPPRTQAGEIRIIGVPKSLDAAVAAVQSAAALAAGTPKHPDAPRSTLTHPEAPPVTGFSAADLVPLGSPAATARALKEAGLSAIANLPIDQVRDFEAVVMQIKSAGLSINTITVQQLDDDGRLSLCERVRDLQNAVGGFKAFAPLPRTMSVTKPTTGYDDVKMVSLARVVVTNVPSIQVDWQLYGPKMAQVALTVGADDIDNVSAVDPGILGTRRSPLEEIRGNIKAAALEPVERDGLFRAGQGMRA